ncbi:GUN4 N-terminal ARM-like repeat domain-containing protein [Pannus brasiliensis CCIBt3594]|uniref:GUN4 N-terminal ARM-like repeat domain-containing protein n=1 Tax=Pannus brasiliensis CCIBt3594 TaxID=1427578 RepID=A0AAW9QRN3_9CHRO
MSDRQSALMEDAGEDISKLASQFPTESEKNQLQMIPRLAGAGEAGLSVLMDYLVAASTDPVNLVAGKAYQLLYQSDSDRARQFLAERFPNGCVPLKTARDIDYRLLQELLAKQDFQTADSLTRQKMCELAGEGAIARKYVYFTEVAAFPIEDLRTIDALWRVHSEGKFGFSVQRKLWISVGQDFPKLWPKIGWKNGNDWTKYPEGFIWTLDAPIGHLPLLNQLRGVRVTASLFSHPAWTESGN